MKTKLLSVLLLISFAITAQTNKLSNLPVKPEPANIKKNIQRPIGNSTKKSVVQTGSVWFNPIDYVESYTPATQVLRIMHVFPDSAIILGFTTADEAVYAWIHKAATYIDPSYMYQQTLITNTTTTYNVDSLAVGYVYERHSANSISDSLIFQIVGENHALDYTTLSGQFPYQDITYNYLTNDIATGSSNLTPVLKRYSVPLKIQDTSAGGVYKQIKIATPGVPQQTNSKKIGVVVSFKPGYTYTITDTLIDSHRTNSFYIISSEQSGTNTSPQILGTPNDYTSDMNMSYILPTDVRYNQSSTGWDGYFLPTYAYSAGFAYETHDIALKLSVGTTGINELAQSEFLLGQNQPNPFSTFSTVNYELVNDAKSVTFTITDVMGRIVSSTKTPKTKGLHTVNITALSTGMYYYSLNVDGNTSTKKMLIE